MLNFAIGFYKAIEWFLTDRYSVLDLMSTAFVTVLLWTGTSWWVAFLIWLGLIIVGNFIKHVNDTVGTMLYRRLVKTFFTE